jgi:hypothetical protein
MSVSMYTVSARAGARTVIVSSSADNLASAAKTIAAAGPEGPITADNVEFNHRSAVSMNGD